MNKSYVMNVRRESSPAPQDFRTLPGEREILTFCASCAKTGRIGLDRAIELIAGGARCVPHAYHDGDFLLLDGCDACGSPNAGMRYRNIHETHFVMECILAGDEPEKRTEDADEQPEKRMKRELLGSVGVIRATGGYVADPKEIFEPCGLSSRDGDTCVIHVHCRGCGLVAQMRFQDAQDILEESGVVAPSRFKQGDYIEAGACPYCDGVMGRHELKNIYTRPENGFKDVAFGNENEKGPSLRFFYLFPENASFEQMALKLMEYFDNGEIIWRLHADINVRFVGSAHKSQLTLGVEYSKPEIVTGAYVSFGKGPWSTAIFRNGLDLSRFLSVPVQLQIEELPAVGFESADEGRIRSASIARGIDIRHFIPESDLDDRAFAWSLPFFTGKEGMAQDGRALVSRYGYDALSVHACGLTNGVRNLLTFAGITTIAEVLAMPIPRFCGLDGIEPAAIQQLAGLACELTGAVLDEPQDAEA
jgi:hypothetical protein